MSVSPTTPRADDVTTYFTGLAGLYAQYRPTYPVAAIEAILDGLPRPARVADVGCGTGISSRLLAAAGAIVTGVDPNPDMLEQARREGSPARSIEYRQGAGERTGLDEASFDAVVCAQAYHWFDAQAALREFQRILRPGGRLALMWNVKDDSDFFTRVYCEVAEEAQRDAASRGLTVHPDRQPGPLPGGRFVDERMLVFANPLSMDLEGALGRARSASYFPKSGPLKDRLEERIRGVFGSHQREGRVTMLYRTEVTLAERV